MLGLAAIVLEAAMEIKREIRTGKDLSDPAGSKCRRRRQALSVFLCCVGRDTGYRAGLVRNAPVKIQFGRTGETVFFSNVIFYLSKPNNRTRD